MFGLIYALVKGAALGVTNIVDATQNAQRKEDGLTRQLKGQNPSETYYDRKGAQRLISNDELARVRPDYDDPCDDKWLWVGAPSVKTRNLSEEERAQRFAETKNFKDYKGRTVDVYDKRHWSTISLNKNRVVIKGEFYRDLSTNETYVCRCFKVKYDRQNGTFQNIPSYEIKVKPDLSCKYYMNVKSGLLVRVADTQSSYYSKELSDKFISSFNMAQNSGGWYKSERNRGPLKEKQDFYCNDLYAMDHIYSLHDLRDKETNETKILNDNLRKELHNV